jgi:hypothetical protein
MTMGGFAFNVVTPGNRRAGFKLGHYQKLRSVIEDIFLLKPGV